jgi:hypothetical protein
VTATTSTEPRTEIEEPGVYDLPVEVYHADPVKGGSLSSSGARKLLPPSCPALYAYEREHPPAPTATFDIGHAAHKLALGIGPELVVVDADDWRTSAAKAARDEAHAAGHVPLLRDTYAELQAMADALRSHPLASALLGDGGQAESSLVWRDESGIMRRCRLDWKPAPREGRMIGWDYKTSRSADPEKFAKAGVDYGYHCQQAWYLDGLRALDFADDDAQFVFIVQEKTPPYLVSVVQLDVVAVRIGRHLNRRAIDIYAECSRTGIWPGYADDVAHVSLPFWYERTFEGVI